jgi:hypothetical protein
LFASPLISGFSMLPHVSLLAFFLGLLNQKCESLTGYRLPNPRQEGGEANLAEKNHLSVSLSVFKERSQQSINIVDIADAQ